jgi:hypothetical protein
MSQEENGIEDNTATGNVDGTPFTLSEGNCGLAFLSHQSYTLGTFLAGGKN